MDQLVGIALVIGAGVFCVELIKRLSRIAVALEKLAGVPPPDFSKP